MSIDDERGLYERLDRAFETITPAPAPIEGAVRRGKTIKLRRRAAAAAGLAAVVAAGAIAVPALRHAAPEHPPASARYTVTVQAPGPHSPAGEIASGTVNGKSWRLIVEKPGTDGAPRGQQFLLASGPAFAPSGEMDSIPILAPDGTDPVSFDALSSGPNQVQYGAVEADVSYVVIRLGNGTALTLHPVKLYGVRAVAFAAPLGAAIIDVTAYSRHGEIATAIPFNSPDGMAALATWLKPGQHGMARASDLIGAGTLAGHAWSVTAYLGPWGVCLEASAGGGAEGSCMPATSGLGTSVMFWIGGTPGVAGGTASASVTRVVVNRPDGTTVQVRPVMVSQQKFFAFPFNGRKPPAWKAYDSSGNLVASSAS
jgi:hypothetical protein